jgi:hypothetical protein
MKGYEVHFPVVLAEALFDETLCVNPAVLIKLYRLAKFCSLHSGQAEALLQLQSGRKLNACVKGVTVNNADKAGLVLPERRNSEVPARIFQSDRPTAITVSGDVHIADGAGETRPDPFRVRYDRGLIHPEAQVNPDLSVS